MSQSRGFFVDNEFLNGLCVPAAFALKHIIDKHRIADMAATRGFCSE